MDAADMAQSLTEHRTELAIKNLSKLSIPYSGKCLFCEEPVEEQRFCGSDCRSAWEDEASKRMFR